MNYNINYGCSNCIESNKNTEQKSKDKEESKVKIPKKTPSEINTNKVEDKELKHKDGVNDKIEKEENKDISNKVNKDINNKKDSVICDKVNKEIKELKRIIDKFNELKNMFKDILQNFYDKKIISTKYDKVIIDNNTKIDEIKVLNNELNKIIDSNFWIPYDKLPENLKPDNDTLEQKCINYELIIEETNPSKLVIPFFRGICELSIINPTNYIVVKSENKCVSLFYNSGRPAIFNGFIHALLKCCSNSNQFKLKISSFMNQFSKNSTFYRYFLINANELIKEIYSTDIEHFRYKSELIEIIKSFGDGNTSKEKAIINEYNLEFSEEYFGYLNSKYDKEIIESFNNYI